MSDPLLSKPSKNRHGRGQSPVVNKASEFENVGSALSRQVWKLSNGFTGL